MDEITYEDGKIIINLYPQEIFDEMTKEQRESMFSDTAFWQAVKRELDYYLGHSTTSSNYNSELHSLRNELLQDEELYRGMCAAQVASLLSDLAQKELSRRKALEDYYALRRFVKAHYGDYALADFQMPSHKMSYQPINFDEDEIKKQVLTSLNQLFPTTK